MTTQSVATQVSFILTNQGFYAYAASPRHIYGVKDSEDTFQRVDVNVTPAGKFVVTVFETNRLVVKDEQYVDDVVEIAKFLAKYHVVVA